MYHLWTSDVDARVVGTGSILRMSPEQAGAIGGTGGAIDAVDFAWTDDGVGSP